jgi:hypothetical protein
LELSTNKQLKGRRPDERREAIKRGQILDPEKRVKLEDAVDFVGSCMDMCPEFEREQREYQRSVDPLEVVRIVFMAFGSFNILLNSVHVTLF